LQPIENRQQEEKIIKNSSSITTIHLFIKRGFYYIFKYLGIFYITNLITRRGLRIIFYHGFSLDDECAFHKRTFISSEVFLKRMKYLRKKGLPVLELGHALKLMYSGQLPPGSVVVTIDDGFYSVYEVAFPILKKFKIPATVYVTSYYAEKENPIFNLALQYIFWKTDNSVLDLRGLGLPRSDRVKMSDEVEKSYLLREIVQFGDTKCNEEERVKLLLEIGRRLGVDYGDMAEKRILNIMTLNEIKELDDGDIDIELHSHRHYFPPDEEKAKKEIAENRAVLEPLLGKKLSHFCYPNGNWHEEQFLWLSEMNIKSSVTCERGLNYSDTSPFALKRFGDDEGMSQIEFEAEICGFTEILRAIRRLLLP
jgi:peptidoglycan/xylan/chitin deacetylase (PgdA/CDA1 family)